MSNSEDQGPIWSRPQPGTRQPRFTRDQIAEAALRIADAEGFEAVSMRRVATELGAGTMTLYHYVRTKDDLVALMDDAIMGEVLVDDAMLQQGWRAGLTAVATSSRDALVRHPWTLEAMRGAHFGPNGMRHFEQSLAATADTGLDHLQRFELMSLVDDYVFGHALRHNEEERERTGDPDAVRASRAAAVAYFEEMMATGEFPHISAWSQGNAGEQWAAVEREMQRFDRFARGLQAVLDGAADLFGLTD